MHATPAQPYADPTFAPPDWPSAIAEAADAMVRRHGVDAPDHDPLAPPIAAFDWDDTCIHGDISHEALEVLEEQEPRGLVQAYLEACEEDLYAAYRDLVHTLVAGRTVDEVRQLGRTALDRGTRRGVLALRPGMAALIARLQARGWWVRVVTASPTALVQPIAGMYGIPPEHVLGMTSRSHRGRFLPELVEPAPVGPGKLDVLRNHTGRDPLFTAGDSRSDYPLMTASRYVLLRHHQDEGLRSEAAKKGWWILQPEVS